MGKIEINSQSQYLAQDACYTASFQVASREQYAALKCNSAVERCIELTQASDSLEALAYEVAGNVRPQDVAELILQAAKIRQIATALEENIGS